MRHTAQTLGLGLIVSILGVVAAEASTAARTCIAESCRPAGRECARAFRETKRAALTACQEMATGGSLRPCRRNVRRAVRTGVQSCRNSRNDCIACCRDGGGACRVGVCGNALREAAEACDGPAAGSCAAGCGSDCTCVPIDPVPICGNAVVDENEECDGTNDAACPAGCDTDCTCLPEIPAVCGNGVVEAGEGCEPGMSDLTCGDRCLANCTCAVCGNQVIEAPVEVCDDPDDTACPGFCSPWSCACLSPTADDCDAPHEIDELPVVDRQSTETATTAPEDPILACAGVTSRQHQRTIWYALTAPATGRIRADPAASTFDTILAAYSGSCNALTTIACSDDSPTSSLAPIDFPVAAGTRYLLEAAAFEGESSGELALAVEFVPCGDGVLDPGEDCEPGLASSCTDGTCSPQCECLTIASDECADAAVATVLPVDVRLAAYQSTGQAGDPLITCKGPTPEPAPSTWFRFRAPVDGVVDLSTSGSAYDTVVGLFVGGCDALTPVACNDDSFSDDYTSFLRVEVSAGIDYTVLVVPWFNEPARRLDLSISYQEPE